MLIIGSSDVVPTSRGRRQGFFGLLDQLRGVAALLVVWAHLVGYFLEASERSWLPFRAVDRFVEGPLAIVQSFGWFGVTLFFFISGFVITHAASRESGTEFIVKRLLRIYPPLVVAVLVALALSVLDGTVAVRGDGGVMSGWDIAANLTLANYAVSPRAIILVVAWTLAVEMAFYLIMWAVRGLIARRALLLSPAVLAIVVTVLAVSPVHEPVQFILITVGMVPLLVIGQLCYLVVTRRVRPWFGVIGALAAWIVWILCMEQIYPGNLLPGQSYPSNALFALLLFVIAVLAEGHLRPFRPLTVLARRSYSLYLIHGPIGIAMLTWLWHTTSLPFTLQLGIALFVVAVATELSYRFVERPSQRLARRLFSHPDGTRAARSGVWLRGRGRP